MKKIFLTFAFVFMLSSSAYADSEPAHIVLGNVINITGGNDSVFVQTDDYSPSDRTTASSITVLESVWSTSPVMYGSIPSEKNALMNPGEPVDIIVRGDKLSIVNWGGEGVYSMRLLDSNGNPVMKDTLRTRQNTPVEISLSPEYRHYYIEFSQTVMNYGDDSLQEYINPNDQPEFCYVLLRMKGTKEEPKREITPATSEKRDSNAAADAIDDIYRRLRNRTVNENDSVLHMNDEPVTSREPDRAIRQRNTNAEPEPQIVSEDENTNLIPARRIRIKHNTEYDTESEPEPQI